MELARRDVDEALSDPEHLADRLNNLGFVQQLAGDLHQAAATFTSALDHANAMRDDHERRLVQTMALVNLGETACLLGDGPRARTALERALAMIAETPTPDPLLETTATGHLGVAHAILGDREEAEKWVLRGLVLARKHGLAGQEREYRRQLEMVLLRSSVPSQE